MHAPNSTSTSAFLAQTRALSDVVAAVFAHLHFDFPVPPPDPLSLVLTRCFPGFGSMSLRGGAVVSYTQDGLPRDSTLSALIPGDFLRILVHLEVQLARGSVDSIPSPNVLLSFTRIERLISSIQANLVRFFQYCLFSSSSSLQCRI